VQTRGDFEIVFGRYEQYALKVRGFPKCFKNERNKMKLSQNIIYRAHIIRIL